MVRKRRQSIPLERFFVFAYLFVVKMLFLIKNYKPAQGGSMFNSRETLLFCFGLAAAFISVCLSAYLIAHAQSGPSREVPAAVVSELATLPWLSLLLAILAALLYFWSSRVGGGVNARSRRAFLVVLLIATALPFINLLLQPAQWVYQFTRLSLVASLLFFPVVIIALIFFWLIGFRWLAPA